MPQIFISYQHDDVDFAENLKHRVEQAGFTTWMDDRLHAGEEWRESIDQAIKESLALIVVMTPAAKASEYVTYEWAFAWGAGVRVIPIMLKQTPLHPRLDSLQYLDFTHRARPWGKLVDQLKQLTTRHEHSKETGTKTVLVSTIQAPDNAPPFLRRAIEALDSFNEGDRRNALYTLSQINLPEAREALVGALDHPFQDVSHVAARILAEQQERRATSYLIQSLHKFGDPKDGFEARIFDQIVDALIKMRDPEGFFALIAYLLKQKIVTSHDETWIHAIIDSLERIGTPEALAAVEQWRRERESAGEG